MYNNKINFKQYLLLFRFFFQENVQQFILNFDISQ